MRRLAAGGTKAAVIAAVSMLAVLALGCARASEPSAESPAESACAEAVVSDWTDGRIDGVYAADCYLGAIESLPEDVRAYSSAVDDISRALQSRRNSEPAAAEEGAAAFRRLSGQEAEQPASEASRASRRFPVPLLLLTAIALVVLAAGAAGSVARRLGRGR